MRHASRTHRVALDWLVDRINLDSKIQIRYLDTKHPLADIVTEGNFTREEWNNLLHVFNISHFSYTCCAKNSSLLSCSKTMAKRMQEQKRRRKKCGKIEIYSEELVVFSCSDKFLIREKSDCIQKSGGYSWLRWNLKAGWKEIQSPTQRRVLKCCCKMHTLAGWWKQPQGNLSLQKRNQGMWTFPSLKLGVIIKKRKSWGDPLLIKKATAKRCASSESDCRGSPKAERQNGHIVYTCLQPQFIIWKQSSRSSGQSTDENMTTLWMIWTWMWLFWGIFLNVTLRAAEHLGHDYEANLWHVKNNLRHSVGQLFNETGKTDQWTKRNHLCKHYKIEICYVDVDEPIVWKSLSDHQLQSLRSLRLCALYGKMGEDPIATWKSKIKWHSENNHFKDMNRIDGMPTESEWKIFTGTTTLGLQENIQSLMRDQQCEPEHFKDRIIFMSMYNDIAWLEKGNTERFECNSQTVSEKARKFPRGHWSFLEPGSEKKWCGTYTDKPDGSWDRMAERNDVEFLRFRSSNISCHQCLWERGVTKQRRRKGVNILQR